MKELRKSAPLGATLVVVGSLFFGAYGVWFKLLGDYFGAFTQATIRHAITASLFILIAIGLKKIGPIYWRRDARWLAISAITSAIIPASWYYAILHSGIGISSVLLYLGLVLGMFFFGWLFVKERYTRDKWLATALGIGGMILIFAPSLGSGTWLALISAFLGAGFASGLNVVASKQMPYNGSHTAAIVWTLGCFANLPFIFLFHESLNVFHWDISWLYIIAFGLTSIIASGAIIQGVKMIEAGAAGILGLLEIVFGVLFGVIFFSERPGALAIMGMVLIVAAAAIPYVKDYNAKRGTLDEAK